LIAKTEQSFDQFDLTQFASKLSASFDVLLTLYSHVISRFIYLPPICWHHWI